MNPLPLLTAVLWAAPAPDLVERGTVRLHYLQLPVGYERYEVSRDGEDRVLKSEFDFTDRGGRVQLAATLRMGPDWAPRWFQARGKSYRFVNVDSEVSLEGSSAAVRSRSETSRVETSGPVFTIDGYAPFAVQMMLLRYWNANGRPRVLATLRGKPLNEVRIELRGREKFQAAGRTISLDRFTLEGVVWGRETVWLDERGAFAAAITRAGARRWYGRGGQPNEHCQSAASPPERTGRHSACPFRFLT